MSPHDAKEGEMALSEDEQRRLDQLEASLAAEDPDLAQKFGAAPAPRAHGARLALCAVGFVVGLAALVGGIALTFVLSVIGFIVMLASVALALMPAPSGAPAPDKPVGRPPETAAANFMDRLGERWSQRRDQGW
jgi:hypothetical protein